MHQLVYSNDCPGRRIGFSPTTPSPRTSCTLPSASVMIQWRVFNCAVCSPSFAIRTVYAKAYWLLLGEERSGRYWLRTVTRMPRVTAVDTRGLYLLTPGWAMAIRFRPTPGARAR